MTKELRTIIVLDELFSKFQSWFQSDGGIQSAELWHIWQRHLFLPRGASLDQGSAH